MAEKKADEFATKKPRKVSSRVFRTEIGKSGLKWSQYGYISQDFLPQLTGSRGIKIYQEMVDNDAVIGGCLYGIRQILREARWSVKPADPNKKLEDDEDAQFLEENMRGMTHSWADFISEAMSMFTFGWAWFEQVYRIREDGKAVWKKLPIRAQQALDRWEMLPNGETIGMWQRPAPDYQLLYIPLGKSIHLRTTSQNNNPEGRSLMRNAYRGWYYKKGLEEVEAIGIERDLVGIPTITLPEGMKMEDDEGENAIAINWAKKILQNIRVDEQDGILLPNGWEFKLVSSPGTKTIDVSAVISRYAKEIAISVLAQFVMLGMERTGSYALATELVDMFYMSLEGFADYIATTFNRQAVSTLFGLNGVHDRPLPYIVHTPIRRQAIKDMALYIKNLGGANALDIDEDLKAYLKRYARLNEYSDARS